MSEIVISEKSDTKMDKPSLASDDDHSPKIVWSNAVMFALLHAAVIYGLFMPKSYTMIAWYFMIYWVQGWGITIGAHRLFTHRSFKANARLRAFLIFAQTLAMENSVYEWVRDHRAHHKFVDTNADPHNSKRGFFFSHIGWLMSKKHPDVKKFGRRIDMSDLEADKLVMFQHKYYKALVLPIGVFFPTLFCVIVIGESFKVAFFTYAFTFTMGLHSVWLINSGAHMWGSKPFDKYLSATDSLLFALTSMGEGWHNFHHCFPWDYKSGEFPYSSSLTTAAIDFFAWIGWATDLKTVSQEVMNKRAERTGDGTHKHPKDDSNNNPTMEKELSIHSNFWGWDDKEMTDADKKCTTILHKRFD